MINQGPTETFWVSKSFVKKLAKTLLKMLLAFEYVKTEAKSSRRYKSGTLDLVQCTG